MSEAELYSSLHLALGAVTTILFGYISLLSGFLFMSYLVAEKLNTLLTSIVIALFSVSCALLVFRLYFTRSDATALVAYMNDQKQSGNLEFDWWGSVPVWATPIIGFLEVAVTIGGYIGCIVFFFYQRKSAR